jgi:hypothetical protein
VGSLNRWFAIDVVERQLVESEMKIDLPGLAGSERDPLKSFKTAYWLFDACAEIAHVALNDFGGSAASGIGYGCSRVN